MPTEFNGLLAFVETARAGSFTTAAARLGVSKAAASKAVSTLEQRLGVPLLVRSTRVLRLTGEGQALVDEVGPSFKAIGEALDRLRSLDPRPRGRVRLSTVTAYGKLAVLPLLPEFMSKYPEVDVSISFHDGRTGLSREAEDIRINWGEALESDKVAQTLCRMQLVLVASPDYLARCGSPQKLADLASHQCITVQMQNGSRGHWTFTRRGRRPYRLMPNGRLLVSDELDAVADAAVMGLGLTVVARVNIERHLRDGSLVQLLPHYQISGNSALQTQIVIQYLRRKHLPPAIQALVDFLVERLREPQPA